MPRVAVLGLGAMGSRIARRFFDAGHDVVVWNRTAEKTQPLVDAGAMRAASPAEACAGADAVVTMLTDEAALREVVAAASATIPSGATFIDMSTAGPRAVSWLRDALPDGVDLVDAPVLGSISEAEQGSLRVFAGGDEAVVARWTPLLESLGTVLPVGPLGSGAAAKLVANSTLFGVIGVLGEALALADGLGLERARAFDVLAVTPIAAQAERRRGAIETGDYPPRFKLSLALKDANLVLEAADAAAVDVEVARAAEGWLRAADAAGLGDADYSAVLARILA